MALQLPLDNFLMYLSTITVSHTITHMTVSRKQWNEIVQVLTKLILDEDKCEEAITHIQRILKYSEDNVRKKSAQVMACLARKKHSSILAEQVSA